MYEMKGALSVRRPGSTGWPPSSSSSAGFPASPFPPGCFPASPLRLGLGFPASPFQLGRFPSLAVPTRPVSQLHRFQFGWSPASPVRAVRLPVRPGATRRPASAKHPRQIPVSRPFPRPGGSPGMVPVPCGECISTPFASVTQEPTGIHFEFFPRPHVVHRIPPVIRTFQRLSTGFYTTHPQVTRRNSWNTRTRSPYVIIHLFSATFDQSRIHCPARPPAPALSLTPSPQPHPQPSASPPALSLSPQPSALSLVPAPPRPSPISRPALAPTTQPRPGPGPGTLPMPRSPAASRPVPPLMLLCSWRTAVTHEPCPPPGPAPRIRRGCPSHVAPAA